MTMGLDLNSMQQELARSHQHQAAVSAYVADTAARIFAAAVGQMVASPDELPPLDEVRRIAHKAQMVAPVMAEALGMVKLSERPPA